MNLTIDCIYCSVPQEFSFEDDILMLCARKSIPLEADLQCGNEACGNDFSLRLTIKLNRKEINQVSAKGNPKTEKTID